MFRLPWLRLASTNSLHRLACIWVSLSKTMRCSARRTWAGECSYRSIHSTIRRQTASLITLIFMAPASRWILPVRRLSLRCTLRVQTCGLDVWTLRSQEVPTFCCTRRRCSLWIRLDSCQMTATATALVTVGMGMFRPMASEQFCSSDLRMLSETVTASTR